MTEIRVWRCPKCDWFQQQHPHYPWSKDDDRAVEVHQTMLCPGIDEPDPEPDESNHDPEGICPVPGCNCDIDYRTQDEPEGPSYHYWQAPNDERQDWKDI